MKKLFLALLLPAMLPTFGNEVCFADLADTQCNVIEQYIKSFDTTNFLDANVRNDFMKKLTTLMGQANPTTCLAADIVKVILTKKPELILFNIQNFQDYLSSLAHRNAKYQPFLDDFLNSRDELLRLQNDVIDNLDCNFFQASHGFKQEDQYRADTFCLEHVFVLGKWNFNNAYKYAPGKLIGKWLKCKLSPFTFDLFHRGEEISYHRESDTTEVCDQIDYNAPIKQIIGNDRYTIII